MAHPTMRLELPEALKILVSRSFKAAKQSKSLVFSDTELDVITTGRRVPFQLRYCPALAKKPLPSPKDDDSKPKPKSKPDPFENPPADLLVAEVPTTDPSHILVLNKYPVIPNHFILATKKSKPQTDLLEQDDLNLAYACLRAWSYGASTSSQYRLFAFFNSGDNSGASQAHRHLQFLPVEDMSGSSDDGWQLLLDRMTHPIIGEEELYEDPDLPFVHYATTISQKDTLSSLHSRYLMLLRAAVNTVHKLSPFVVDPTIPPEREGKPTISYNLAMTTERMAICPRRNEPATIPSDGAEIGINGTILGGTLMVKGESEWRSLREKSGLLDGILLSIGFDRAASDLGSAETKL